MKKAISLALALSSIATVNMNSALAAGSNTAFGSTQKPTLLTVGSTDGFVLKKLKKSTTITTAGKFDMLDIGSSSTITEAQKKQAIDAVNKNLMVIIDGPPGNKSVAKAANDIFGFSIDAEAVVVKKSIDNNGYSVTPIDNTSIIYEKSLRDAGDNSITNSLIAKNTIIKNTITNNTVENIFGI